MRSIFRPFFAACGTAAVLAALMLTAARPAAAQTTVSSNTTVPIADVRLGIYAPSDGLVKDQIGTLFAGGGLDYYIVHSNPNGRAIVSLDYIEGKQHGQDLRIFPLTVGYIEYADPIDGVRPYGGFGAGAYFVHSQLNNNGTNDQETKNNTAFGGYIAGGLDFGSNFFLEARYHFISQLGLAKPSGLQVDLGVRF